MGCLMTQGLRRLIFRWFVAFASIFQWSLGAFAATHALIIGIGQYPADSGVSNLLGTARDIERATDMAKAMGATNESVTVLKDRQASKSAILSELDRLQKSVKDGDRVFIYISSHGTRYDSGNGQCREGILPFVSKGYTVNDVLHQEDLQQRAIQISKVAEKVILMADTCHSGGVVASGSSSTGTRALSSVIDEIRPKTAVVVGQRCDFQENSLASPRSLLTQIDKLGSHQENFVQIAAAGPREASWDTADGGLSTRAIAACLLGDAIDLNRSGGVTLDEVRACAQAKHNQDMMPFASQGRRPSTIQITGARNLIATAVPTRPNSQTDAAGASRPQAALTTPAPTPAAPPAAQTQTPAPVALAPSISTPPISTPPASTPPVSTPPVSTPPTSVTRPNAPIAEAPRPQEPKPPAPTQDTQRPAQNISSTTKPGTGTLPPVAQIPPVAATSEPAVRPPALSAEEASLGLLEEILSNRNPRIRVEVEAPSRLRINRDEFQFSIKSSVDGYLYVLMLGSDRESFYMVFPNGRDGNNRISKDRVYAFPRLNWSLTAGGPPGTNRVMFVVTENARLSDVFEARRGGGDIAFYASSDLNRAKIMNHFLSDPANGGTRQYGAALRSVTETQ